MCICRPLHGRSGDGGEAKIPRSGVQIAQLFLKPHDVRPNDDAIAAIAEADVIILGPGKSLHERSSQFDY